MKNGTDKIIAKYEELAKRYTRNVIVGRADSKRHDLISHSEAKMMLSAEKDSLSIAKIGMIFNRDIRSVSKAIERTKEAQLPPGLQLSEVTATTNVEPTWRASSSYLEPYKGMQYVDIPISSNDISIESIIITTSHPRSPYTFLVFDREQPLESYNDWDVFWKERVSIRRTKYITPQPQLYHDIDGCKHLHCAFEHEGHPIRFDLHIQELDDYFRQPVAFKVTLQYRLSS